ncbi:alpha/beta fold hydrolase [Nocardia vermiculata]|uniref:alpha/beta fold hydrolase n=1 Tax=Nocardia vermiculata TaxID=257274 RepID=UPI001FE0358C|nr:alpha/beta hydrolase [Nocardia vermiculata]
MTWELPESIEVDGGAVRWARLGSGQRSVVLVHGTPYSSFLWREIAPALAERHTVYVFDHLGYGRSEQAEGQDLTLAAQARRFTGLLHYWGLDTADSVPTVIANDIGGAIALRALLLEGARYRDMTLFDCVSGGQWERGLFALMRAHHEVFEQLPGYAHEALVAAHLRNATHVGFRPGVQQAFLRPWLGSAGQAAYYRQYRQLAQVDTEPYEPLLSEIDIPVQLLWGREDRILPPEALVARTHSARPDALDRRCRPPPAGGRSCPAAGSPAPLTCAASRITAAAGPQRTYAPRDRCVPFYPRHPRADTAPCAA